MAYKKILLMLFGTLIILSCNHSIKEESVSSVHYPWANQQKTGFLDDQININFDFPSWKTTLFSL